MLYNSVRMGPPDWASNRWRGVCLWGLVLSVMPVTGTQAAFQPVLTEFMASNRGTLADEDGATSDWVEIANLGSSPGNLL